MILILALLTKPMKIAITGVTGFRNRGVEALVRPTIVHLRKSFPGAEICVATWSPDYDAARLDIAEVKFVKDAYLECGAWVPPQPVKVTLLGRIIRKGLNFLRRKIGGEGSAALPAPAMMPFPKVDLLVISGGDLFGSDYGTRDLVHHLEPLRWAKENGIPAVMLGQSIGPFKNETDAQLFVAAAQSVSIISMREPLSRNYLIGTLKLSPDKVRLTADMAFLLEVSDAFVRPQGLERKAPETVLTVGISISASICKWTGSDYQLHIDVWSALIDKMISEWDVRILLIPHVQEAFADDRVIATKIFRKLAFDPKIQLLAADLTAGEFKGVLQACDLVIAERMHAAIGALSTGICTVPIGYSIKAQGIIESVLDGSGIPSREICMPIEELLDLNASWSKLQHIWNHRVVFQKAVAASLERSKAAAASNIALTIELMNP